MTNLINPKIFYKMRQETLTKNLSLEQMFCGLTEVGLQPDE